MFHCLPHLSRADVLWATVDTVSGPVGSQKVVQENSLSWSLRCQELKCSCFWQITGVCPKAKPALLPVCLYFSPTTVKTKNKQQTLHPEINQSHPDWSDLPTNKILHVSYNSRLLPKQFFLQFLLCCWLEIVRSIVNIAVL